MTDDGSFPGVPSPAALARVAFATAESEAMTNRIATACVKILQATIQDLSARDSDLVDRIKRVFTITPVSPDLAPSVDMILSGITRPDDPCAVHEREIHTH